MNEAPTPRHRDDVDVCWSDARKDVVPLVRFGLSKESMQLLVRVTVLFVRVGGLNGRTQE